MSMLLWWLFKDGLMSNSNLTGWCIFNINQHPRQTLCFKSEVFTNSAWASMEEWKEAQAADQDSGLSCSHDTCQSSNLWPLSAISLFLTCFKKPVREAALQWRPCLQKWTVSWRVTLEVVLRPPHTDNYHNYTQESYAPTQKCPVNIRCLFSMLNDLCKRQRERLVSL